MAESGCAVASSLEPSQRPMLPAPTRTSLGIGPAVSVASRSGGPCSVVGRASVGRESLVHCARLKTRPMASETLIQRARVIGRAVLLVRRKEVHKEHSSPYD